MTSQPEWTDPEDFAPDTYLAETLPLPAIDLAVRQSVPVPVASSEVPDEGAGLARVARGATLNLAGAVVSAGCAVGLTVVVTHSFSKSAAGAFFVAMSLFLIAEAVANLGAYNGTIYFIARLRALRADRRIPAIMRATVIPVAVSSVLGALALVIFATPFARFLLQGKASQAGSLTETAYAVRALAAALPFAAMTDTLLGATRGYHAMRPTVAVDRIGRSVLQLLGVFAAAAAGTSALLAPLWAVPYLPASALAYLWLRRITRRYRRATALAPSRGPDAGDNKHGKPNAKGFWRFTAPRSLASIAQIIIQRLDIVLVGILRGPEAAAIYTAATRFLVAGQLGNGAISAAAQPQFTRLFTIRDRRSANAVYQVTTAWLVVLTWPLYLLAIVFGPSVLAIFGRNYDAGSTVMVILGLTMLVATACGQVDVVLITAGRSSWSLFNGLLAMGVNVGVDLLLIPRMGITGAAIGWAAAIALTNLVPLAQVAATIRIHPFGRGTLAAGLLSLVSFAVIPLALRAAVGTGTLVTLAAVLAGCAVMAAGLWLLRDRLQLAVMPGIGSLNRRLTITRLAEINWGHRRNLPEFSRLHGKSFLRSLTCLLDRVRRRRKVHWVICCAIW